ncbi:related to GDP/GTP exchange factor Rom2p [Cephalotrichum gorgonifer]|uniref:Related to GDP/GTP exchange factor Rom2p n=1 Tax=Cephalotrichum gorgonifer TaxID=2041049 RepID=A0AAE8MUM5_9PEZI|nr:related to GDP/GTP exchange factor Rom2p [Cephalotrichum gorgonifer]
MADYHRPSDRGPPQRPSRAEYGVQPANYQRDAAFSNIFGAAPPPGRSHTMTSSVEPPQMMPPDGRTNTMSSYSSPQGGMHDPQRPPPRQQHYAPQYQDRHPPQQRMHPPDQSGGGGYYPAPRAASGGHQVPSPQALQYMQQQQRRPPPPGPGPVRYEPRGPPPPRGGYGPGLAQRYQPGGGPPGPPPAMNGDQYRSQSLVSNPRQRQPPPGAYHLPPQHNSYQSPANASRYDAYNPNQARTTAQGRVVPDRGDERAMSMTGGYSSQDRDAHQTMSGRVIPNRRFPAAPQPNGYPQQSVPHHPPHANSGYAAPGSQTRSASMASSTAGNDNYRTMSMASTIAPTITSSEADTFVTAGGQTPTQSQFQHQRSSTSKSIDSERPQTAKVRAPLVYPALLSRVGECFARKIITGEHTKNELTYKNAFTGAEAVDVLSYIIRTTDRNLALLLGRSLDAQKFFHDVTYEHRLRDSPSEIYQFRETLMDETEDTSLTPNGVFVLLSECYSPTCTRDQLCYSIACPRRLEQVSRLNLKVQPGLQKDRTAAGEDDADQTDEQKLWINSVPKEIADSIDEREQKRQEVISELCYTERDFVKDLEYLRDFWIIPLRSKVSPIPIARRDKVVRLIFSNIVDYPSLHAVSSRFAKAMSERQQKSPIVRNIGDIFLDFVPHFEPFIYYGSKQLDAKFEFENERSCNVYFSKFVDEIERRKESRKLELNGYLTKPTTRLARYPLLLENVLKYTEDGNRDKDDIPKVLVMIRDLLARVNAESGKAENRFNLRRLHEQLRFRPSERVDLRLTEEGREIVFKTQFKKSLTDPTEITAFLFDHAVLLVRIKKAGKGEEVKAYRRPIPLELLDIKEMEEVIPQQGAVKRSSSSLIPSIRTNANDTKRAEWPITFRHLGKNGYELTLYATNQQGRKKWLEFIDKSQQRLRARADFFNTAAVSTGFFGSMNHVNCVTPFDGSRKLLVGTDSGVYVLDRKSNGGAPKRVLETPNVTQVDVLEEYQLLLVLSNKALLSYSLSALDPNEPALGRRPKKIQSHCNFFKTGICLGRHLVCAVKSSALSTTIKVYEPNDAMAKTKKQKGLGKMFGGGQDELRPFKEFYIPAESSSVHFLKSKLCVACAKGFEVVSLETLETQSLLDQADTSLDFVARKEGSRPIHIERLSGEFLLNYSEFSFFVNKHGWRARPEWKIEWEGSPGHFALSYPWILGFGTNFIELRDIESGAVHIVPHKNIRMLHQSTNEILYAYEDERGGDVIESIDFWKSNRRSEAPRPPSPPHQEGGKI